MLHQTWAYASTSKHSGFKNYNCNQLTMYQAIADAVKKAAKVNKIKIVIPSGTAIQNARTSFIGDHLNRDGNSLIHGQLIAVVVFKSTMLGSRRVRPGLVQHQLCFLWKACFYIFYKFRQRGFIRLIHSRKRTSCCRLT